MRKGWKRIHRLVVLPDYQGIGIGTKFINEVAKEYIRNNMNVNLTTTTPALVHALAKDRHWALIRKGRTKGRYNDFLKKHPSGSEERTYAESSNRVTYSFNFKK